VPARNPSSYLATIVLDLALIGGFEDEYRMAHNDFAAVGALPLVKEVDDSVYQYSYDPINTRVERNARLQRIGLIVSVGGLRLITRGFQKVGTWPESAEHGIYLRYPRC